ncbi:MAG: UDP-N-acetylmuramoyl-tripeptide--D-alanyl-D-alanine ligase [Treponema sp.]|jgi:UDP-N-acetylmuramoyl-tripeptide--D-alanyl-D-alanine ligase|nr:UDP-N-acetylmuramoyl-tripeptide--D-alanyl-D-alanine ligase [Treponema sp.]
MDVLMSYCEASQAAGGRFPEGADFSGGFTAVSIDSRTAGRGSLFTALPGAVHDGHRFIEDAFRAGAGSALVARSKMEDPSLSLAALARRYNKLLIIVEDTLKGLQSIAGAYLDKFPRLLRVGITGSSGKTTTKEIAAALVGQEKKTVVNTGNLNSETGLPLSVFKVRQEHEAGIFEMGMNRKGEISELAGVLKPGLALITNIGSAHIGILGTKGAIAEEKKNIFSRFSGNETALIPEEDEYAGFLSQGVKGRVVMYGPGNFPELKGSRDLGLEGSEINWDGRLCRFGLPGKFNLKNAFAALAIARELGVSAERIQRGLESVRPLFGRGEIVPGKVTVVRDCYNSNPESLEAAVEFCDSLDWPGRRVYVIGSMLELGRNSGEAHRRIGRVLASSLAEKVFLYGAETETTAAVLASRAFPFFHTEAMEDLEEVLEQYIRPGDLVLLKGSRGCALEQLTGILTGEPAMALQRGGF